MRFGFTGLRRFGRGGLNGFKAGFKAMASGGARINSGPKPRNSLSDKALGTLGAVVNGMGDGLVLAGRRLAPDADDDTALRLAVAGISHDLVMAGRGMELVTIFTAGIERMERMRPQGGPNGSGSSLLDRAMRSLPGAEEAATGTNRAQGAEPERQNPATVRLPGIFPGDAESPARDLGGIFRADQPVFSPQGSLFPAFGPGAGGGSVAGPVGQGRAAAGGGARPGQVPPTPPAPQTPAQFHPRAENFEIFQGQPLDPGRDGRA